MWHIQYIREKNYLIYKIYSLTILIKIKNMVKSIHAFIKILN